MARHANDGGSDRSRAYDSILVPTDGSACARAGARHGVRIARGVGATVHAVHVRDVGTGLPSLELSRTSLDREDGGVTEDDTVAEVAEYGAAVGVQVATEVVEGQPVEALQEYITDIGADLVAMGTRGRTTVERHLLGSVTQRIVRSSPVPVLTVGTGDGDEAPLDRGYTDILLPTRGGDGSELAVDHAITLAARFDATVHVLYVVDVRSQAANHETYELGPLTDELHAEVTDEAVARAADAGVETSAVIQQGTPHSAIQRYVGDHDIDLIVMGTHGRGRVRRFLLGSITERTIRTADVPVLTVRLDEWFDAEPTTDTP